MSKTTTIQPLPRSAERVKEILDGVEDQALKKILLTKRYVLSYFLTRKPNGREMIYAPTVKDELKYLKHLDVLYPIGDPIYIAVYFDEKNNDWVYHPVEPTLNPLQRKFLDHVEKVMVKEIDETKNPILYEEKSSLLDEILRRFCTVGNQDQIPQIPEASAFGSSSRIKATVSGETFRTIKYVLEKERLGYGILTPFIKDMNIEDVSCPGIGAIYIQHKVFATLRASIGFTTNEELDAFALRLAELTGRPVTHRNPIADAALPDGSRLNLVYGEEISRKGTNFTIRKFTPLPLSITQLIKFGTIDPLSSAYLWTLIRQGINFFVIGETASGKTTTLKALTTFIKADNKVVSIEDTPEVYLAHGNWLQEISRPSTEKGSEVSLFDLLKAALRQRPNYIIVGEIRGQEGHTAFQAMQTGHPVISTFHAASIDKLVQRLAGEPINVPKTFIDNLNLVLIQHLVADEAGYLHRVVMSINEIIGYDSATDAYSYIEVFFWNPITEEFVYRGDGNSFLLEAKIAPLLKIPRHEIHRLYDEIHKKADLLKMMVTHQIFNYFDVWEVIKAVEHVGIKNIDNLDRFLVNFMKTRAS